MVERKVGCDDDERGAAQGGIVDDAFRAAGRADRALDDRDGVGESPAVGLAGAGDDSSAPPVEHVARRIDDGEGADDELAEAQTRRAQPAFHSA